MLHVDPRAPNTILDVTHHRPRPRTFGADFVQMEPPKAEAQTVRRKHLRKNNNNSPDNVVISHKKGLLNTAVVKKHQRDKSPLFKPDETKDNWSLERSNFATRSSNTDGRAFFITNAMWVTIHFHLCLCYSLQLDYTVLNH